MKLRNKKTGEIINTNIRTAILLAYDSLAEFNEEWEDYEEPKEYVYITGRRNIHFIDHIDDEGDRERKEIGNYFTTKEEAEKAVEKLKAWKRLKDAGFVFEGYDGRNIKYNVYRKNSEDIIPYLDLLFGGEDGKS